MFLIEVLMYVPFIAKPIAILNDLNLVADRLIKIDQR